MYNLYNLYFAVPLIVGALAQISKVIIDSYCGSKFTLRSLWSSGGMPSAHSTLTSSVLIMVILFEGFFSTISMVVGIFSLLIWYDAANVRYESGKHAQYINSLRSEMHKVMNHDRIEDKSFFSGFGILRERLGHTPTEISIGVIFGIAVTLGVVSFIDSYIINF